MKFIAVLFIINCVVVNLVLAAISHEEHYRKLPHRMEKRDSFIKIRSADKESLHELVFHLQLDRLDELEDAINDRSSPSSPRYQQWLTLQEVVQMTRNQTRVETLLNWLSEYQIEISKRTKFDDFVIAQAKISVWEDALRANFNVYVDNHFQSREKSTSIRPLEYVRSEQYELPRVLHGVVRSIFNSVQVPPLLTNGRYLQESAESAAVKQLIEKRSLFRGLTDSEYSGYSTIEHLKGLYGIPTDRTGASDTSFTQAVFETSDERYSVEDLHLFQTAFELPIQNPIPINSRSVSSDQCGSNDTISCYESNLDLQYIMGISTKTPTYYWFVRGNASDVFLDYLLEVSDTENPPLVHSISWGSAEVSAHVSIKDSFNTIAMRLAAIGVSIFVSSGDNGVSHNSLSCYWNSGSYGTGWEGDAWSGMGYFPSFPATCPYVTAVGGTQGRNPFGLSPTSQSDERVCQSDMGGIITSGGGFSTFYPIPNWQSSHISSYFSGLMTSPAMGYNKNGRGYPDIAFSAVYYPTIVGGVSNAMFGTSASAPLLAAIVSLINTERIKNGKSTVGFINPSLYAHSNKFNDITVGSNGCTAGAGASYTCCSAGFTAAKGWDPVSGLGSISFSNLEASLNSNDEKKIDAIMIISIVVPIVGAALLVGVGYFVYTRCFFSSSRIQPQA